MGLLSSIEAAIRLGTSVEILEYFRSHCPKQGETRLLPSKLVDGEYFYDQVELDKYRGYLNRPWPHQKGKRPPIPDQIKQDVRRECHHECAVCGNGNNGEVAHIEAVSETLNNSPDNLIFLCPNHHTQYDLGFRPSNNLTLDVVRAAKLVKRNTRQRMQKYEANAFQLMKAISASLKSLEEQLKKGGTPELNDVYLTETRQLMSAFPELLKRSQEEAKSDQGVGDVEKLLEKTAPKIFKLAGGLESRKTDSQLRTAAQGVVSSVNAALIEIDEVACPHCSGSGMIGLAGNICQYCKGDTVVSQAEAEAYDSDELDEVPCPRCGGKGMTGWSGDTCAYCKGASYVTHEEAESYDEDEIDEVVCPRCSGKGTTGWNGDACAYCKGSCYVSRQEARDYDVDEIDEVDCPRCGGKGTTGWNGDACAYCKGSRYVSRQEARDYDEGDIDEVDCPHCAGKGTSGWNSKPCAFCGGSCYVSREDAAQYDTEDLDEANCPRCGGTGTIGFNGRACALCNGDCTVSKAVDREYRAKNRDDG